MVIKCKKCFKEPIIGYRYKCSECNNYNLCQDCEEQNAISGDHPHNFIKIRKEEQKNNIKYDIKENSNINDDFNKNLKNMDNNNDNNDLNKKYNILNNNNLYNSNIQDKYSILDEDKNDDNNNDNDDDNNNTLNILNKDKEDEDKNNYSYECLNLNNLNKEIFEGEEEAKIEIIMKNNKNIVWPKDNTKLVYDYHNSNFIQEDIVLEPQKYNEERKYNIIIRELDQYPTGEYNIYLWFEVNDEHYGERIGFKIIIKEKKNEIINNKMNEHLIQIEEFRNQFQLSKEEYTNEKIFEILEKNNFNFEQSFMDIIN